MSLVDLDVINLKVFLFQRTKCISKKPFAFERGQSRKQIHKAHILSLSRLVGAASARTDCWRPRLGTGGARLVPGQHGLYEVVSQKTTQHPSPQSGAGLRMVDSPAMMYGK